MGFVSLRCRAAIINAMATSDSATFEVAMQILCLLLWVLFFQALLIFGPIHVRFPIRNDDERSAKTNECAMYRKARLIRD